MLRQTSAPVRLRERVPDPPRGVSRIRWWGPGLLWAMSAVGSGSVLFTPRVGSEYGYAFGWLLLGVAVLMWVLIREAGRFAVATGRTVLDGFSTLPGPRNWALWVVFVPQLVAAVAGVGGLSALVGSAVAQELPGGLVPWSLVVLGISTLVVVSGGYRAVSRAALVLALALVGTATAAAAGVLDLDGDPAAGLVPSVPEDASIPFLLPWVGTILAGSMGIVWFSYWAATRGYGGRSALSADEGPEEDEGPRGSEAERGERLTDWFRTLSVTAAIGVVTGTVVIFSFLVLGAELLGPQGIVPSGTDVAADLTTLLSDVWGTVGHWVMVAAIIVALGGSVLANQDGWSRTFADIVLLLPGRQGRLPRWIRAVVARWPGSAGERRTVKILFALVVTALLPAVVVVVVQQPVTIMSVSGIIATIHTPFLAFTVLAVNRRIPEPMRPGAVATGALAFAGAFYTVFGVLYLASMVGLLG